MIASISFKHNAEFLFSTFSANKFNLENSSDFLENFKKKSKSTNSDH